MYKIHTIEGEIAASWVLIENGVPDREADQIVDCLVSDPWEEIEQAILADVSCWTNAPDMVLRAAIEAAQDADDRVSI